MAILASEKDNIRYANGLFSDITERKQAEAVIEERSRLQQTFLDALPCIALLLRPSSREIVASNKAAVEVGAVPGAHCFSTWGQREDPCPWCLAPKLWQTDESQSAEFQGLGVIWEAHWIPIDEDLYLHYAFDITERKQAEEELRMQSQVLDDMSEGVNIIKNEEGIFIYTNSAFEKMLGYDCI